MRRQLGLGAGPVVSRRRQRRQLRAGQLGAERGRVPRVSHGLGPGLSLVGLGCVVVVLVLVVGVAGGHGAHYPDVGVLVRAGAGPSITHCAGPGPAPLVTRAPRAVTTEGAHSAVRTAVLFHSKIRNSISIIKLFVWRKGSLTFIGLLFRLFLRAVFNGTELL